MHSPIPFVLVLLSLLLPGRFQSLLLAQVQEQPSGRVAPERKEKIHVESGRESLRESAWRKAEKHLDWATERAKAVPEKHIGQVDEFFARARKGVPGLADDALGWGSKWRVVTDHLPWIGTDGSHAEFMRQRFEERLFAADDIEKLLRQVCAGIEQDLLEIDNEFLVRLRLDIEKLGAEEWKGLKVEGLDARIRGTLRTLSSGAEGETLRSGGTLVVGEVLAAVVTRIAARLALSGTVLGSGAAAVPVSFGLTVVVGIIVDQILNLILDWAIDSRGNLVRAVEQQLDEMRQVILDGNEGLRRNLQVILRERDRQRREAVRSIFLPTRR